MPFFDDPRHMKILFFFVLVGVVIALMHLYPGSLFTRTLSTWHGPVPRDQESLASFTFRNALYAVRWLVMFSSIWAGLALFFGNPWAGEPAPAWLATLFALVLFTGMAALAAIFLIVKAGYARLRYPQHRFTITEPDENGYVQVQLLSRQDLEERY